MRQTIKKIILTRPGTLQEIKLPAEHRWLGIGLDPVEGLVAWAMADPTATQLPTTIVVVSHGWDVLEDIKTHIGSFHADSNSLPWFAFEVERYVEG